MSNDCSLRIAAFGVRRLPPAAGCAGAETFADELYSRFVQKGHSVTVYCRRYPGIKQHELKEYKGIKLLYLPTVQRQGFDTLVHGFLCAMHIIVYNTGDIIHIHNAGNSIWVPLLRLFGKKCFISIDGFDWRRSRWPWYARIYLRVAGTLALRLANHLIVDNIFIQQYYQNKHVVNLTYIPYGVSLDAEADYAILDKLGLKEGGYLLFVGRFVKEKGIHYLIRAFEELDTDLRLVLVGGNIFDEKWVARLKSTKDPRIMFAGYIYGPEVEALLRCCYLYVQPSDVEGLSPVILRAMGSGRCVVASDIPENRFLVEGRGEIFRRGDVRSLKETLARLLADPAEVERRGRMCRRFIEENFSWDLAVNMHLKLFTGT